MTENLRMKESIGLFMTLSGICVLSQMSDGKFYVYLSGEEISRHEDRKEAERAFFDFRDELETEAVNAGKFVRNPAPLS